MGDSKRNSYVPIAVFLLAYIGLYFYLGLYAHPFKDDYVFAYGARIRGALGNALYWYRTFSPRIPSFFLVSLFTYMPVDSYYWLYVSITLLAYMMSVLFLISSLYVQMKLNLRVFITMLVTAATLAIHCSLTETMYWLAGMLYFWSSSMILVSIAMSVKALHAGRGYLFITAAVLFISCMFMELSCVFQGTLAFLAYVYFRRQGSRQKAAVSGVLWLVCIAAFFVMYLAPGTTIRSLITSKDIPFLSRMIRALMVSAAFGFFTIVKFFIRPVIYAFLLFLPDIADFSRSHEFASERLRAWHIVLVMMFIALLNHFIGGWSTAQGLEFRGESLTIWMMGVVWVFMWSCCYRGRLSQRSSSGIYRYRWLILCVSLMASSNFTGAIQDLSILDDYRAEHQAMLNETQLQLSEGKKDIIVPLTTLSPKVLTQSPFRPSPNVPYANLQYTAYYDLDSCMAIPGEILYDQDALSRFTQGDMSGFERAAEGNAFLSFLAGEIYDANFAGLDNVPEDNEKAIYWYTKAAELGNVQSCRRLVRIFVTQSKDPDRYIKAGIWFLRSELPLLRP